MGVEGRPQGFISGEQIKAQGMVKSRKGDFWYITALVCNPTDRVVTLIVTSNPIVTQVTQDSVKLFPQPSPKDWPRQTVTIPNRQCLNVVFGPYDTKPLISYLDTYESEESWEQGKPNGFKIGKDYTAINVDPGAGEFFAYVFPFPNGARGFLPAPPVTFSYDLDLGGLPRGWHVTRIEPPPGHPIAFETVSDQQVIQGEIETPKKLRDGTFAFIGLSFYMVHPHIRLPQGKITFAYDTTPPALTGARADARRGVVTFRARARDVGSTIQSVWARYRTDRAKWEIVDMLPDWNSIRYNRAGAGIVSGAFRGDALRPPGRMLTYEVFASDHSDNTASTEKQTIELR